MDSDHGKAVHEAHVPGSCQEKDNMLGRVWSCDHRGWVMLLKVHQTLTLADEMMTIDGNG